MDTIGTHSQNCSKLQAVHENNADIERVSVCLQGESLKSTHSTHTSIMKLHTVGLTVGLGGYPGNSTSQSQFLARS